MNKLSELQLAYIAGFIDGEGCIFINKIVSKRTPTPIYTLGIAIVQNDYEFLNNWANILGCGTVSGYKSNANGFVNKKYNENQKICYQLRITAKDANDLLLSIIDHLMLKKKQAELAIEFQKTMNKHWQGNIGKGSNKVPKGIIELRELYYNNLKELKHGGDINITKLSEEDLQLCFF